MAASRPRDDVGELKSIVGRARIYLRPARCKCVQNDEFWNTGKFAPCCRILRPHTHKKFVYQLGAEHGPVARIELVILDCGIGRDLRKPESTCALSPVGPIVIAIAE